MCILALAPAPAPNVYFGVSPCGGGVGVGNRLGARAGAQVGLLGLFLAVNIRVILLWGSLAGGLLESRGSLWIGL